ncbi:hypothetical protein F5X71_29940 [Nocardia brasiliensis]|uniref:Uncharacterized protein n=1 Tax=Nocardia brasiliensis TaxID=37326 RepID=A0A6G9XYH3_NOCBR|nr:hypothetical protein [Nocardia brasiliensis]QIS05971.1 hypothetical protein F5X71_29940 [Nocardia brasiliensis]
MERVVEYTGRLFINFREFEFEDGHSHCYRWIDAKQYALTTSGSDDRTILADLIASAAYRDDYVGSGWIRMGSAMGRIGWIGSRANLFRRRRNHRQRRAGAVVARLRGRP